MGSSKNRLPNTGRVETLSDKLGTNHGYLLTDNISLPCSSDGKESACQEGDAGLIPGSGRSPGEGNGNPLQDSCLGNPLDKGAWQATHSPWGCKESDTTERLHFSLSDLPEEL